MATPMPAANVVTDPQPEVRARRPWLTWLLGTAMFGAVVAVAANLAELRDFADMIERAQPGWVLVAIALQVGTYWSQGAIWRVVARAAATAMSAGLAFTLSVAELFVDQSLPTGGASGTAFVARALRERGVSPTVVASGVVLRLSSGYAGYALTLAVALVLGWRERTWSPAVLTSVALFCALSTLIAFASPWLAGRPLGHGTPRLARLRLLRRLLGFLRAASPALARSPRLLLQTTALQTAIILLDAATMWVLLRSLGAQVGVAPVFTSFMLASFVRSIGIAPGGLGTFEATSVVTLHWAGVPMAVALAATLVFRGLSFWLPMIPGLVLSRRIVKARAGAHEPRDAARRQRRAPKADADAQLEHYWALSSDELLQRLGSRRTGLSEQEAAAQRERFGPNTIAEHGGASRLRVLAHQLQSPLLLVLVFAACASAWTGEWVDGLTVLTVIVVSVVVSYLREYSAEKAAAALRERVRARTTVLREGAAVVVGVEQLVPGDVVRLAAGSLVPADCAILEANDLHVNQAVLTGESFPKHKRGLPSAASAGLADRDNCLYLGTNVRSGATSCVVVRTGLATQFGGIAHRLTLRPPETDFDRGVRHFGYLLTSTMLVIVLAVFGIHILQGRPAMETLLFAVALAVGLSPELLPVILNVNLSRGAKHMAERGVLVRRLNALENLGSMNVLCTDKTGTLTEGVVALAGAHDPEGRTSERVLDLGVLNASLSTGLENPIDEAVRAAATPAAALKIEKLGEIPFDFSRKRVSVIVREGDHARLIAKGACPQVLAACVRSADGCELTNARRAELEQRYRSWNEQGVRVLAVATRTLPLRGSYGRDDETALALEGFLCLSDRPKQGAAAGVARLEQFGVAVKIVTGDARAVAQHVAQQVGLRAERVLTGPELDELHDEALWHSAERTDIFAEVDPNQKERIILALKKMGHVVGFLGDGVNDAPAMHAADVSLSVDQAVDVAREAADLVLLERKLEVIHDGIAGGRTTLANTLKYVLTTTSANLGNMLSMAAASLFLPFLPLLSSQILLNNFLSDIPAFGIASDAVDPEMVARPRRWEATFIGHYMVAFGLLSSAFDLITFAVLGLFFHAQVSSFRSAWFVESLLTELLVALVVRTARPAFRSRPGHLLLWSTVVLAVLALAIPFLPFAAYLGFVPLSWPLMLSILAITTLYVIATEGLKRWFYRQRGRDVLGAPPHGGGMAATTGPARGA